MMGFTSTQRGALAPDNIQIIKATHRQNFLIPPRAGRAFPLVELLDGVHRQFLPSIKA